MTQKPKALETEAFKPLIEDTIRLIFTRLSKRELLELHAFFKHPVN